MLGLLEHRAFLPTALTVGFLLRLAHLWAFETSPFADRLQLDHAYQDEWAQRIAEDGRPSVRTSRQTGRGPAPGAAGGDASSEPAVVPNARDLRLHHLRFRRSMDPRRSRLS